MVSYCTDFQHCRRRNLTLFLAKSGNTANSASTRRGHAGSVKALKRLRLRCCLNGGAGRPWPASRTSLSETAVIFLTALVQGKSCTTPHHTPRSFPESTKEKTESSRNKDLNTKENFISERLTISYRRLR